VLVTVRTSDCAGAARESHACGGSCARTDAQVLQPLSSGNGRELEGAAPYDVCCATFRRVLFLMVRDAVRNGPVASSRSDAGILILSHSHAMIAQHEL